MLGASLVAQTVENLPAMRHLVGMQNGAASWKTLWQFLK